MCDKTTDLMDGLCLSFLVDACSFLLERGGTVGLFRKPGCLARIKTLRVRLLPFFFFLKKHNSTVFSESTIKVLFLLKLQ